MPAACGPGLRAGLGLNEEQLLDLAQPALHIRIDTVARREDRFGHIEKGAAFAGICGKQLRQRLDRRALIDGQNRPLIAQGLLEASYADLRMSGQQPLHGIKLARLDAMVGHADVDDNPGGGVERIALGKSPFQATYLRLQCRPRRRGLSGPLTGWTVILRDPAQSLDHGRAVDPVEHLLLEPVACIAIEVKRLGHRARELFLHRDERIIGGRNLSLGAHLLGQRRERAHQRVLVGEGRIAQAQRVKLPGGKGELRADHRLDPGLQVILIESIGEFRHSGDGRKLALVLERIATERPDIREAALLDAQIVTADIACARCRAWLLGDDDLVEPRRHRVDEFHVVHESGVLLCGHFGAHKDRQVPDLLIQAVEDCLTGTPNFIDVLIAVEDPIKSLLGRRDVVPLRAEADDRRLDITQIEAQAVAGDDLRRRELVAYEKIIDDVLHLFPAHQNEIGPPFLELKVAALLLFRVRPDVVLLAP